MIKQVAKLIIFHFEFFSPDVIFLSASDNMKIQTFTYNPFSENTYLLIEGEECIIVDPGCYTEHEQKSFAEYISSHHLKPVILLLTHAHIDHVLGNSFVHDEYGLLPVMDDSEIELLQSAPTYGTMWGVHCTPSPMPVKFLNEGDEIKLGNTMFSVLFTPGHSVGSVCFYDKAGKNLLGGDVLFRESIGRTDLPGGNFEVLENSIRKKLYTLPDDVIVYPGHGPVTTIGHEKKHNPFVRD